MKKIILVVAAATFSLSASAGIVEVSKEEFLKQDTKTYWNSDLKRCETNSGISSKIWMLTYPNAKIRSINDIAFEIQRNTNNPYESAYMWVFKSKSNCEYFASHTGLKK